MRRGPVPAREPRTPWAWRRSYAGIVGAVEESARYPAGSSPRSGGSASALASESAGCVCRLRTALAGMAAAVVELRETTVPEQLFDAAARAAVDRCGFDRALVFTVGGSELVAQSAYFKGDEEGAARALLVGQSPEGRPQLNDFIVETEILRRRTAALIPDAQSDPHTPRALVEETKTRSYVAAPIICDGRVAGFIHGDQYFKGVAVDGIDRDVLFAFAGGLGVILERQLAQRRLQAQRRHLGRLASEIQTVADGTLPPDAPTSFGLDQATLLSGDLFESARDRQTLSAREREVIQLLVEGATNASIARRLFISESTAKAHVHHILKKLGATNRADAVSKFLRGSERRGA